MTKAQIKARFKAKVKRAKAIQAKNPKKKWTSCIKEAWKEGK